MKSSIIVAIIIFLAVIGWIGSGQITNVSAKDEDITTNNEYVSKASNEGTDSEKGEEVSNEDSEEKSKES